MTLDALRQWTIKSLSVEVVELAHTSAKQKGMKINAWMAEAIRKAAAENDTVNKVRVVIYEKNHHGFLTLRRIQREYAWSSVPRTGEQVSFDKKIYTVESVGHDFENDHLPTVQIVMDVTMFTRLAEDPLWTSVPYYG